MDKISTQIQETFEQFFVIKQGFLASKKYKKNTVFSKCLYTIYLTKALKVGHFHCYLKTFKYKYCPKFGACPKWKYNLQPRIVTSPDQEKLLEKIDGE